MHSSNSDRPFVFTETEYINVKMFEWLPHNARACRLIFVFLRPFLFIVLAEKCYFEMLE